MHLLSTASLYWGDARGPARLAGPTIGRCATRDRDWELLDNLRPKLSIKSNKSRGRSGKTRTFVICWTRPPEFRIRSNNSTLAGAGGADERWRDGENPSRCEDKNSP